MAASDKRDVIKNSQLFWRLSDSQIDKITGITREETCGAGTHVFSAGDRARYLYIVVSGKVALEMEIRIGSRTRKKVVNDVITKNQVFGWPSVTERPAFSGSATCIEDTRLLEVDGERLRALCDADYDLSRKVMYELVNLVSDRLEHTKRTLAHVLSVTSHDLRAPLATVLSSLDAIIGGFAGEINIKQKDLLQGSKQRIHDLMNMIDNILDISYIELSGADFEKVSLADVVQVSLDDVEGMNQQKKIQFVNRMPGNLPQVLGISKRLRQVFTNLFSNAVKFTPPGGMVVINARETDDVIRIEVADTGIGIPPDELPKLFGDFYRGMKVDAEGAGLGLAIAKKIVEAHGGRIWAESPNPDTGLGSRFTFNLPKTTTKVQGKEEEDLSLAGASILVADDDPQMRKVTSLVLESQGYKVRVASDGEEALARIAEEKPDLLILDLLMPKMDGFEVLKRLDEQAGPGGNQIPILIFSAVREESSKRRYELETNTSLSFADYIEKPVSPPILIQRVEKILKAARAKAVQGVQR
ncbi:MAG: response regulator [Chloroflexi bacterium]|nr:response regulator [Chloroflexota bacterium]